MLQVTSNRESLLNHCFSYKNLASSSIGNDICLRLSNLSLSRMGSIEKLLWVQMLDLSHNELHSIEGILLLLMLCILYAFVVHLAWLSEALSVRYAS